MPPHSSSLRRPSSFTVLHWNVLASVFGKNTNPWFLHGVHVSPDRRRRVFEDYFARDSITGALKNPGWPSFARGVLNEEEMKVVETEDGRAFKWSERVGKIERVVVEQDAEVVSLVEVDEFEDFRERFGRHGYVGEFALRPRKDSKDGCAIFWKADVFQALKTCRLVFEDGFGVDHGVQGTPKQDRCALLLLLKHLPTEQLFAFASTHLARDVLGAPPRDAARARQFGALAQELRSFVSSWFDRPGVAQRDVSPSAARVLSEMRIKQLHDIPVIVCGDVNAKELSKLTGLVHVSALLANSPKLHPAINSFEAVKGGATSTTEARSVRVDAILFSSSNVEAKDLQVSGIGLQNGVIPNDVVPSDHYPLLARFGKKSMALYATDALTKWCQVVMPESKEISWKPKDVFYESWSTEPQLDSHDLKQAFDLVDRSQTGKATVLDVLESIDRLGLMQEYSKNVRVAKIREALFKKTLAVPLGGDELDFAGFCAAYVLRHPICEKCAETAFNHIDENGNDSISEEELAHFFLPFERSALQGDAAALFEDAQSRNLCEPDSGMTRKQFTTLLGAKFVECEFDDGELAQVVLERMGAARRKVVKVGN